MGIFIGANCSSQWILFSTLERCVEFSPVLGCFLDAAKEPAAPLCSEAIVARLPVEHARLACRTVGIKLLLRF